MTSSTEPSANIDSHNDRGFFGHPAGLSTLFFTEMWERMSYYGMRGLLVLFMTAALMDGGMGLTESDANAIYGLYTGFVYFMGLAGGWIADRLLGSQKAVWYGGIVIMCGHITLAIPNHSTFFVGLILVVMGTGLLKPNISALVGGLYSHDDQRRDAGYTLYYMCINLGSIIGYTFCGLLAEKLGWHYGFGLAAIGMALGLIYYYKASHKLKGVGVEPTVRLGRKAQSQSWLIIWSCVVIVGVIAGLMISGLLRFSPVVIAQYVAVVILAIFALCFIAIFLFGKLTNHETKRVAALLLICIASACFFSGFEQAGSSLNLFGQNFTDRVIGGFEIPTTWLQNANPIFIVVLSPFIAALWINLGKRMLDPSYGIKCAIGVIIMGSGFVVMYFAAHVAASSIKAPIYWLVMTYFLHSVGELCLSPVALSAVSKLSPRRFTSQLMGVFILTYSIGSVIAGLVAGEFDSNNIQEMPGLFLQIFIFTAIVGAGVFLLSLITRKWERYAVEDGI